jgi:hypothetical protein
MNFYTCFIETKRILFLIDILILTKQKNKKITQTNSMKMIRFGNTREVFDQYDIILEFSEEKKHGLLI